MYTSMNNTSGTAKKDNGLFWEPITIFGERYVCVSHEPFEVEWLDIGGSKKLDPSAVYQLIRVCKPGPVRGQCASRPQMAARKLGSYVDCSWLSSSVIECRRYPWEEGVFRLDTESRTLYFRVRPGSRYN